MKLDKRKFLILGGVIAFVMIMVMLGIVAFRSNKNTPPGNARLQFWGTFDSRSFYQEAIDAYTKINTHVTIEYREIPFEDYESTLISAFAAGNGPDMWLMHNTWLPKHRDKIAPLTPAIERDGKPLLAYKDFQEGFVDVVNADLASSDGTIYALPIYVDTLALYYNKDVLNSHGITSPPRTWEDFVRVVKQVTKRDDRNNISTSAAAIGTAQNINRSTDILMLLMLQSGVRMTAVDNTAATFARPVGNINVGEIALQFYTDFANIAKPDRYTWNDFQKYSIDAFTDGNTAMMINYSHHIKTLRAKAPRLNFGIAPVPQPAGASVIVNYANYWAPTVAKQSAHTEEAWKFLVYLSMTDAAKKYLDASDRPAARRDLVELQRSIPELGVFAVQSLSARSWYQTDSRAIETIFAKLIDSVNFGRATARDALREAEAQVSVIMQRLKP